MTSLKDENSLPISLMHPERQRQQVLGLWRGTVTIPSLSPPAQLTGMHLPRRCTVTTALGWGEWWQGNTPVDGKKEVGDRD